MSVGKGYCSDAPFKSSCLSVYDLQPNNPFREHSPLDIPNQQCSNIPSKEGEALLLLLLTAVSLPF